MSDRDWLRRPLRLSPDNFTPLSRTPWAGQQIANSIKAGFVAACTAIGESWEFSCDPAFPSRLVDHDITLLDLVEQHPQAVLGEKSPDCRILVKLLNAATPLSLQVHPTDDDPYLATGECGKPESWLVLAAQEGAGLYLGFSESLAKNVLASRLRAGEDLRNSLQFVPVKRGDYFEIEPGVVHAVGPGVLLLEPQRVIPGRTGKTYRFWDWGRKYNAQGREDPAGKPRELHLEAALRLVDPAQQCGEAFVKTLRRTPSIREFSGGTWSSYPANETYQVHLARIALPCELSLASDGYAVLVILDGQLTVGKEALVKGESVLIPAASFPLTIRSARAQFGVIQPTPSPLTLETP